MATLTRKEVWELGLDQANTRLQPQFVGVTSAMR